MVKQVAVEQKTLEALIAEHGDIIVSAMGDGLGWRSCSPRGRWQALRLASTRPISNEEVRGLVERLTCAPVFAEPADSQRLRLVAKEAAASLRSVPDEATVEKLVVVRLLWRLAIAKLGADSEDPQLEWFCGGVRKLLLGALSAADFTEVDRAAHDRAMQWLKAWEAEHE